MKRATEDFTHAWGEAGCTQASEVAAGLVARWSESHRAYHTFEHLRHCVDLFSEVKHLAKAPFEVLLSIWFHDAVYDTRAVDNEQKSAELAREMMLTRGAGRAEAESVAELVLSTRHGHIDLADMTSDQRLLNDIDLSILGCEREVFAKFEKQIRSEYAWVEDEHYRASRTHVLCTFLERARIFHHPELVAVFEERARENLTWAIGKLTASDR